MTLPAQLRGLADLVESVEDDVSAHVEDVELIDAEGHRFEATLRVVTSYHEDIDDGSADEPEPERRDVKSTDTEDDVHEEDGAEENEERSQTEDGDTSGALDGEARFACDTDGCDYRGGSERALKIHQSRTHDGSRVLKEKIAALLEEEGELPASGIKSALEASGDVWNRLSSMQDEGLVETRKDPEDGRRTLYRLGGRDPDEPSPESRDTAVDLPGELTPTDVNAAAEEFETLGEVANELDMDVRRTRTILFRTGDYGRVKDVTGYRGRSR